MHTRIYKCAVMRWAHLQMRCANLQMRLHLNCENGRCRPLRRFPRHAAISPRQQGTMRRVSALTFTNAHFAHFYAQKGPFPKPQVNSLVDSTIHRRLYAYFLLIPPCIHTKAGNGHQTPMPDHHARVHFLTCSRVLRVLSAFY